MKAGMMSQDEMRGAAETLKSRFNRDPQSKARVLQNAQGTLRAEGYADALIGDVEQEVAMGHGGDFSGFAGCRAVTCVGRYLVW